MKKSIANSLFGALLIMIIIGGFTSCNDSLDPIFYTLEQERPIEDDSLDNEITVHNVVTDGSYYFAAAPKIFYRATGSTSWQAAAMPQSDVMCQAMEVFGVGDDLYAGFYKIDGSSAGLFTAAPSTNLNWGSRITDGAFTDGELQIIMIKEVNSNLLVSTAIKNGSDEFEYSLYYYDVGGSTTTLLLDSLGDPIMDVTYGSGLVAYTAVQYWAISGSKLYRSNVLTGLFTEATVTPSVDGFGGVYYASALAELYLGSKDGRVYKFNDTAAGGSWTSSATISDVAFTRFIEVGTDLLVGTRSHGYYKITGGDVAQMERQPHYSISDLYNGGVLNFAQDGAKLFACSAGAGLWRHDDNGGEYDWNRE